MMIARIETFPLCKKILGQNFVRVISEVADE
jgi:hypothetical protein